MWSYLQVNKIGSSTDVIQDIRKHLDDEQVCATLKQQLLLISLSYTCFNSLLTLPLPFLCSFLVTIVQTVLSRSFDRVGQQTGGLLGWFTTFSVVASTLLPIEARVSLRVLGFHTYLRLSRVLYNHRITECWCHTNCFHLRPSTVF